MVYGNKSNFNYKVVGVQAVSFFFLFKKKEKKTGTFQHPFLYL